MPPIYFASSNQQKYDLAKLFCQNAGVEIEQVLLGDIPEIQGENPRDIIEHKAREAFKAFGKPVVVSDDNWNIPALNGFPGPYMKSVNYWFEPEDFLRLMQGKKDRRVYLEPYLAYVDELEVIVFEGRISGLMIEESRGTPQKSSVMNVLSHDSDAGLTVAEVYDNKEQLHPRRLQQNSGWQELLTWYKEKYS